MPKRILWLFLAFVLALSLSACDLSSILPWTQSPDGEDGLIGDGTSYHDFIAVMQEIKERGDETAALGLPVNSEYYYSFAGASVSALRYAAEYILWLKGEGDTIFNAVWTQDGFAYSVSADEGLTLDQVDSLVELVK